MLPRHRHRRPQCTLLPLLALLLLLSACMGEGEDSSDDETATPSGTTAAIAPAGTASPAPVVSPEAATPPAADNTPTLDAPASATPTLMDTATAESTATATTTPMATPVTSDDPVVQALLDAMPPLDLFPEGWVGGVEMQSDSGFMHSHCRMQPYMALDAHVVANGGNLDEDDISDSMGPNLNAHYQVAVDDRTTGISLSIMDLSAVPIENAGQIIVEYFLSEGSCETWEQEPGRVYTYSDVNPAFPMVGDNGVQWARAIHYAWPLGEANGLALVFSVGNRLVPLSASAPDPATVPQALVESVAQSIAASLQGTAFEPERRALLDALSTAGVEIPMDWKPLARQVTAYPDDGLPHHCGLDLPLPVPEPLGEEIAELRVMTDFTAAPDNRSTRVSVTVMHLPTAADAQSIVAFHDAEATCTDWTADVQRGMEIAYAPVDVIVPRLDGEPLWARAITIDTATERLQGVALVYAVGNRVVFLTSYAPVAEPIPAYVLETLTWKLTEALRRFPARATT